tara:strand:- start:187 stop:411 length:225 start_codon:yes stop_codon:yes gene_type:complete
MKLSKREPKHMGEVMSDIAERYDKLTKTNKMNEKELQKIIEKLNNLDQLVLPNGATGAVWLEDVIDILKPKEDE